MGREMTMEQQWSQGKARQETESRETVRQTRPSLERERLAGAGLTARAVLEGAPLWDLPPVRLEELAGWLGNQGMNALIEALSPLPAEIRPPPLAAEPDSAAFPVPDGPFAEVAPPVGLTAQEPATAAADPSVLGLTGLAVEGGGADGFGV